MSKRKNVPRPDTGINAEEEAYFSGAIRDVNLSNPIGFEKEITDDIAENIPFRRLQDSRYPEWCDAFISLLKNDKYRGALNALRQLRQYDVHLGFTMQGVFDFVCKDLYTEEILGKLDQFHSKRELSAGRLRTIKGKVGDLSAYCAAEPEMFHETLDDSRPMQERKMALIALIRQGLDALSEIYEYELSHSEIEHWKDDHSTERANHLRFILPPENYFKGQRWWPELAEIMTAAAVVVISKGWSTIAARFYTKDGLQSLDKELTDKRIERLRAGFKANLKDFFEQIEEQLPSKVLDQAKLNLSFSPSPEGRLIADLAEALRDGRIKRDREG